ncbi:MAG: ectoine/hydroxyectoine ABC transporter ATP-binding protein EhuA [Gaiellaceae bacterium]
MSTEKPSADISFAGVVKRFGDHTVIESLDLEVPAGQRIAIIGPSGSGKTTVLRLLMTLEQVSAGSIKIAGDVLADASRHVSRNERHRRVRLRRRIGMVFQQFNLFPHMSALENIIDAPIHVLGMSRRDANEQAHELLAEVGLADKADLRPRQLSGGQQQRVAIARAIAMRPEIMLFDEVTSALDPELVGEVLGTIKKLANDTSMTMLIVTHMMTFAREVADRVILMDHGCVVEDDKPDQIFSVPKEQRTRAFLQAVLDPLGYATNSDSVPAVTTRMDI